jgi:LysM repeat protein
MTPRSFKDANETKIIKLGALCVLAAILTLAFLMVLPIWVLASPPAQEQVSDNLLVDGDFEAPDPWIKQDGIDEVQVAPGWLAWYLDESPPYVQPPSNCDKAADGYHCYWMRPEFRASVDFAHRIHGGVRSQKYFSYGRMHEGGLMQQVSGIAPGARVRFSIWMQTWMCFNPSECGKEGIRSDTPSDMHLRVGIDPLGETDPLTTTILWSAEQPAWDEFVQFQVETVAISDTVTVFTHSRPEWDWARNNNDVYLDDASLVIVGAYATPTTTLSLSTTTPARALRTATPTLTPTPFPEGAVTYTVQMGDTLFDIALKHSMKVDDLLKLNQITTSTMLYVGQPLVIQIVPFTPTPSPTPTVPSPTPQPSVTPQPSETPTPAPTLAPVETPTPTPAVTRPRGLPIGAVAAIGVGFLFVALGVVIRVVRR